MTKIPRCPDPTEPGTFLCRRVPRANVFVAVIERGEDGCLTFNSNFEVRAPISKLGTQTKWWGPITLQR